MDPKLYFEIISLAAGCLATYVTLKIKPLEDRIMKLEKLVESHVEILQDMLQNYNRWRGEVTAELRIQTELLKKLLARDKDDHR